MSYTREQAIDSILEKDPSCPRDILESLVLLDVKFLGFDSKIHEGQIVVHQDVQKDIVDLFELMQQEKFPLEEVSPVVKYSWDDEASMSANNSSGFNYRKIAGQDIMSFHSQGKAIDLNPRINPWVQGETIQPANGSYNIEKAGTLFNGHPVVEFMKERGWEWLGDWEKYQDYQHFQKEI